MAPIAPCGFDNDCARVDAWACGHSRPKPFLESPGLGTLRKLLHARLVVASSRRAAASIVTPMEEPLDFGHRHQPACLNQCGGPIWRQPLGDRTRDCCEVGLLTR